LSSGNHLYEAHYPIVGAIVSGDHTVRWDGTKTNGYALGSKCAEESPLRISLSEQLGLVEKPFKTFPIVLPKFAFTLPWMVELTEWD
jgi:hypothetical protein